MSTQIIPAFTKRTESFVSDSNNTLSVSEFFFDTIQGEGHYAGFPAVFLRLAGCTLNCIWCDTKEVWRFGQPYTFKELFEFIERFSLVEKFQKGHHLVVTGGSPLKQQKQLIYFIDEFEIRYGFIPFIEIENECTIWPEQRLYQQVSCWNNSPKLSNSGNPVDSYYHPAIIAFLSIQYNSWFKFVIKDEKDWDEIKTFYLDRNLILKRQVILMPQGATRKELMINGEVVAKIAIENSVRYTSRDHILLWDKKTGV